MRRSCKNENEEDESNNFSNNNITNNNEAMKLSRNKLITEENEQIKIKEKKGVQYPLNTESVNLNEPLKTIESARKGMLENPNNINNINLSQKSKGSLNITLKSGDWDVRNENSIKQIEIKSVNSTKNQINTENKNFTMSDFEESFREENIPKKI